MDYKNFTLDQLESNLPEGVRTIVEALKHKALAKRIKSSTLTISDNFNMNMDQGSENMYLTFKAYTNVEDWEEFEITIYSKENHQAVKDLATQIISAA